jgi:RNA polymerase sigma-32 factor
MFAFRSGETVDRLRKIGTHEDTDNYELIDQWRQKQDEQALTQLVDNHKKLVSAVANGYRGYGLPIEELIAEGHIGIMLALDKFDSSKGFKFSTYAVWWIRSKIRDFVMRTNSLVSLPLSPATKTLFFALKSQIHKLGYYEELTEEQILHLATELKVQVSEVKEMLQYFSFKHLTIEKPNSSEEGDGWSDWLADTRDNPEEALEKSDSYTKRKSVLDQALACLTKRDFTVFWGRRLKEPPKKLEELSQLLNISKERVRQIEQTAFSKIQNEAKRLAQEHGLLH